MVDNRCNILFMQYVGEHQAAGASNGGQQEEEEEKDKTCAYALKKEKIPFL